MGQEAVDGDGPSGFSSVSSDDRGGVIEPFNLGLFGYMHFLELSSFGISDSHTTEVIDSNTGFPGGFGALEQNPSVIFGCLFERFLLHHKSKLWI
ncbi:hypothetical protein MRB53_006098 [Persea americana]|uniref:Uncharacterized protein n=1 Tax=Persea americana TaxID=3435 RepID=A0ACC2MF85_PERAE|nr:hypothetical protein MRB53_006098 [Persea americana]